MVEFFGQRQKRMTAKRGRTSAAKGGNRPLSRAARRRNRGQGLVEGACGMILLCAVGIPLLILLLNIGTYMTWTVKLNYIAGEAARYIDSNKYWLGMKREDYNRDKAIESASNLANAMLKAVGLPEMNPQDIEVNEVPVEITPVGSNTPVTVSVTQVIISPHGLTLGLTSLLPPGFRVHGVGISADASNAISPPMIISVTGKMQTNNGMGGPAKQCNLTIPGYCAGTTSGGYTDPTGFAHPRDFVRIPGTPGLGPLTPGYKFIGMAVTNITPAVDLGNSRFVQR